MDKIDKMEQLKEKIAEVIPHEAWLKHRRELEIVLDKIAHPEKTLQQLYREHYPEGGVNKAQNKGIKITKAIERVKTKYPELFEKLRDHSTVQIGKILGAFNNMALDESLKPRDRVSAGKELLKIGLELERMAKESTKDSMKIEEVLSEIPIGEIIGGDNGINNSTEEYIGSSEQEVGGDRL